jgi:hypothetical protein
MPEGYRHVAHPKHHFPGMHRQDFTAYFAHHGQACFGCQGDLDANAVCQGFHGIPVALQVRAYTRIGHNVHKRPGRGMASGRQEAVVVALRMSDEKDRGGRSGFGMQRSNPGGITSSFHEGPAWRINKICFKRFREAFNLKC